MGGGTETVTSLAKTDHGDGLRLHIKVNSLFFVGKIVFKKATSTTMNQVLYCLAVVSLALHVLTILYAAYGIPELAYNRQSEQAFGIPAEQILAEGSLSDCERRLVRNLAVLARWQEARLPSNDRGERKHAWAEACDTMHVG